MSLKENSLSDTARGGRGRPAALWLKIQERGLLSLELEV